MSELEQELKELKRQMQQLESRINGGYPKHLDHVVINHNKGQGKYEIRVKMSSGEAMYFFGYPTEDRANKVAEKLNTIIHEL